MFILAVVDNATNWPEAFPLPHRKACAAAKSMIKYF